MVPAIIIAAAAILGALWAISVSNRFKGLLIKIDEADSGIDVALTKRYDTLVKMTDVVKSYAKHEADILEKVIKLRSGMSMSEKNDASRRMDAAAERVSLLAEAYPELRSSENYRRLQEAIQDTEDHLQAARRLFNMNVSAYNRAVAAFPGSIVAGGGRYGAKEFFEAEKTKRSDVKIDL